MYLFSWIDSKVKNLKWYDVYLIKLSVLFATLMLVKFFPQLLSWEWYWYLIIAIVIAIPVWIKMFK
jgi:hypothetical protein